MTSVWSRRNHQWPNTRCISFEHGSTSLLSTTPGQRNIAANSQAYSRLVFRLRLTSSRSGSMPAMAPQLIVQTAVSSEQVKDSQYWMLVSILRQCLRLTTHQIVPRGLRCCHPLSPHPILLCGPVPRPRAELLQIPPEDRRQRLCMPQHQILLEHPRRTHLSAWPQEESQGSKEDNSQSASQSTTTRRES